MKILKIVGVATEDERAALLEFVSIWERGKSYSELLKRLPTGRVEVHVGSDADDHPIGIIFIDHGVVSFLPSDKPEPGMTH